VGFAGAVDGAIVDATRHRLRDWARVIFFRRLPFAHAFGAVRLAIDFPTRGGSGNARFVKLEDLYKINKAQPLTLEIP
jgi:hypothetical protein